MDFSDEEIHPSDDEPPSTSRTHRPSPRRNGATHRKPNADATASCEIPLADNDESSVMTARASRRGPASRTRAFRRQFFPDATDRQWNDWRWQSQSRIRKLEQFEQIVSLSDDERDALVRGGTMLPVGVTPYYMSLLDAHDPQQPLRKTVIPTTSEFERSLGEADDPLGEDGHSPVPYVIDAPGGGGKIPLQPNSVVGRDSDWLVLQNFEGKEYRDYDPETAGA